MAYLTLLTKSRMWLYATTTLGIMALHPSLLMAEGEDNSAEETAAVIDEISSEGKETKASQKDVKKEKVAATKGHKKTKAAPAKHHPVTAHPSGTVTIQQALSAAYSYNTEIKAQRALLRAYDERIAQAKSGYRPYIGLEGSLGYTDTVASGTRKDFFATPHTTQANAATIGIRATQNLFQGFGTIASVEQAENERLGILFDLYTLEQRVFVDTITAYMRLLGILAESRLLKGNVATLQETLKASREKFNVGEETRTSMAQAESQLADYTARLASKEAELEGQKATFKRLTGLSGERLLKPKEFKGLPKTLEASLDKGLNGNPAIQAARYRADAAMASKDKATAQLLPTVDLEASSQWSRTRSKYFSPDSISGPTPGFDNQTQNQVLLKAKMPLYEQGLFRGQIREAAEKSEQARIDIENARRQIIEQITQFWTNFKTAHANVGFYRQQVAAQEISLEGTRQEMVVGIKILLDVLDEQSKLLQAQQNLVGAERDYYIAGFQLIAGMGILRAEQLDLNVEYYDPEPHYQESSNSL